MLVTRLVGLGKAVRSFMKSLLCDSIHKVFLNCSCLSLAHAWYMYVRKRYKISKLAKVVLYLKCLLLFLLHVT